MLYRINKKKLHPFIIMHCGSVGNFVEKMGITKMRWSQITRTNYKSLDVPAISKIKKILFVHNRDFIDELKIGE